MKTFDIFYAKRPDVFLPSSLDLGEYEHKGQIQSPNYGEVFLVGNWNREWLKDKRSFSVGDIAIDTETKEGYACDGIGWRELTDEQVNYLLQEKIPSVM